MIAIGACWLLINCWTTIMAEKKNSRTITCYSPNLWDQMDYFPITVCSLVLKGSKEIG